MGWGRIGWESWDGIGWDGMIDMSRIRFILV